MRTRRRSTIQELRRTIDRLPRTTRIAMLDGIRTNEIIVGAYSTRDGICPMLAAHRAGGRTDCISFAKAWDRFAFGDVRRALSRRATRRELLVLRSHLEASLLEDETGNPDLAAAISEHEALRARARHHEALRADAQDHEAPHVRNQDQTDSDRNAELRNRSGWAWLRVTRRLDEYERALTALGYTESGPSCEPGIDREPVRPWGPGSSRELASSR